MSADFKLGDDGTCPSCNKMATPTDQLQCFWCQHIFHVLCTNATGDNKIAKKTVSTFQSSTLKRNFTFLCDCCITSLEIQKSSSDTNRLNCLETKVSGFENKLDEICSLLKNNDTNKEKSKNVWFESDEIAKLKTPPPIKSILRGSKSESVLSNKPNASFALNKPDTKLAKIPTPFWLLIIQKIPRKMSKIGVLLRILY